MRSTELVTVVRPQSATTIGFDEHERASPQARDVEDEPTNGRGTQQELAPIDGGLPAWRLLCAAFMFEALLWGKHPTIHSILCSDLTVLNSGFPLSFGVFQEYYSKVPEFANNRYISVVGTIASGFGYLGAPIIMPFIQRYQRWQRQMIWVGCKSYN